MPSRHRSLLLTLAFLPTVLALRLPAQTGPSVPIHGPMLPGMERFDPAVIGLMTRLNSPGAQLAVLRSGRLVLARGYGYADHDAQTPILPDSLFRVASLTKFLTAVATLTLVEQRRLDLEMKVFPFIGLTPFPAGAANADPRVQNITVRQLLHHTGGWDRDISGDLTLDTTAIANAAGMTPPADVDAVIRHYLGVRLDFDPGTRYAYSNFGYVVLGRIIEKITGQSVAGYYQSAVLGKAGITRTVPGRSHLQDRQPGEVRYYDYRGAPLVRSSFPPTTALVPAPYNVVMENRHASGAYLFTAIDYVRLLGAVDGSRPGANILSSTSIDILTERPAAPIVTSGVNHYGMGLQLNTANGQALRANWFHSGGLPGTTTYMVRFSGGWSYAIFFNTRVSAREDVDTGDISAAISGAISATTPPATGDLFLTARPEFVSGPASVSVASGASVSLAATVSSVTPATHQWFKNGSLLSGATTTRLSFSAAVVDDAGDYHLVSTNAAGATTSASATLAVAPTVNPGRLVNLSILTSLAGASDNFTLGYVAGGAGTSGTKPLLIRAAGPSLGALGVPGTLDDPRLELYLGARLTGQNDNWGGAAALASAMAGVGAFAYMSPASRDAAALTTVNAGENNSVRVMGSGSGQVIAELYDATPADQFTATTPRLLNVSVLKPLGSGLAVGFSIGGATPVRVLVRAIGPTLGLAPFSLDGVVADPQLVLYQGGTPIGENNDWGGSPALSAAVDQVGAFALPSNSRDAVILATLSPGNYSTVVSGVAGATGLAIVEVYEVPDQ